MKLSDWHCSHPSQHPKHTRAAFTVGVGDVMSIEDSDTCDRVVVTMKNGDQLVLRGPGIGAVRVDAPVPQPEPKPSTGRREIIATGPKGKKQP
jgi:hypothetical protein